MTMDEQSPPVDPTEISPAESATPVPDVAPPPAEEAPGPPVVTRRVIHASAIRDALRAEYGDACQVCGRIARLDAARTYAEVHALVPAGPEEPEDPPREHCLVLCPEHHAMFDHRVMSVDPERLAVWCSDGRDPLHGKTLLRSHHSLARDALRAAFELRYVPSEDEAARALPRHTTFDSLLADLFSAALDPDEDHGFERYMRLVPGGPQMPASGRKGIRQFQWAQLRRRAPQYLRESAPASFVVAYTRPEVVTAETPKLRVLLECVGRNPGPVVLVRGTDGFWWLEFNGL